MDPEQEKYLENETNRLESVVSDISSMTDPDDMMYSIMETLNDYAAVEYFGISTLTIGIFRSWFGMYDMESALKLSSYLILFVFSILITEIIYRGKERYNNINGSQNTFSKIPVKNKKIFLVHRLNKGLYFFFLKLVLLNLLVIFCH